MASSSEVSEVTAPVLVVTECTSAHVGGLDSHVLAVIGTDLNLKLGFRAVEQFHCIEFSLATDSGDFVVQLVDFFLHG